MDKLKISTIIVLLFALSACGYRLAGKADLDPVFDNTFIGFQSGGREVARLVENQFKANGIKIVAQNEAEVIVDILYERRNREILTVDEQGRVREYELIMRVGVDAKTLDGKKLLPSQDIRLTRDFLFDIDEVLGNDREQGEIYQEMREDIARLIIYRLQAISLENIESS